MSMWTFSAFLAGNRVFPLVGKRNEIEVRSSVKTIAPTLGADGSRGGAGQKKK